jgi:hypothetical protein
VADLVGWCIGLLSELCFLVAVASLLFGVAVLLACVLVLLARVELFMRLL